jgi:hypothetical protein
MPTRRLFLVCVLLAGLAACGERPSPGAIAADAFRVSEADSVALGLKPRGEGMGMIMCLRDERQLFAAVDVLLPGDQVVLEDRTVRVEGKSWPLQLSLRVGALSVDLPADSVRTVVGKQSIKVKLTADLQHAKAREALARGGLVELGALGRIYSANVAADMVAPVLQACPPGQGAAPKAKAAASPPVPSGRWQGHYQEGRLAPIPFEMQLSYFDGIFHGNGVEPDLRSRREGRVSPSHISGRYGPNGDLRFTKVYEPSIGLRGELVYEGRLSADGSVMEGRWSVDGRRGSFRLRRVGN